MKYQNILLKYSGLYFKLSVFFTITLFFTMITECNFSYENGSGMIPTGLHPVMPPFSNKYHGTDFRFPYGACSEAQCHGNKLTGGNSGGLSCFSCHNDLWSVFIVSHTVSIEGSYHHYAVPNSSDYKTNCGISGCHGDYNLSTGDLYLNNFQGYNFRYSCYACHSPIP